jgi:RNA polymerase sigma-70 factor (ECF subfamily)
MNPGEKTDDLPTSMGVTLALAHGRPPAVRLSPDATLAGERPTPAELFERHVTFVWRVVAAHGVREADVPDVTQDVFVAAFRRLGDWEPARASATSWLYAIAVRIAANHRRKAHVRRETPGEGPTTALETDPGAAIDRQRLLAELDEALSAMDAPKRDAFVLFEIAELTMHEVALTVGCPLKTAYKRLYAARRELAEKLGDKGRLR